MFDGQGIAILKKELEKAKLESSRTKSEGEERRLALILGLLEPLWSLARFDVYGGLI